MDTIKAYIALTKPRVIELLLVATIPAMLQAQRGENNIWLIALTLIGGWMGAGAANAFNMVADSDIDQKMGRTRARPLVRQKVGNREALIFAWTMLAISLLWLGLLCHSWLAAFFVALTNWFYVYPYTKWLKRRTWQNVIWGGAAGCMPVIVGWAVIAANDPHSEPIRWWQAIVMFLIIFFWTPPHTWALAMKYRADYERAGVPMLPVVKDEIHVTRQITGYTWATVVTSLLLVPAASWIYLVVALAAGAYFIFEAVRLQIKVKNGATVKPLKLFILSNNYLAVLFVALSIDAVLGWAPLGQLAGFSGAWL